MLITMVYIVFMEVINMLIKTRCSLAKARKSRKLSQAELAEIAGVSRCSISYIENGRQDPTRKMMEKIAKALKMSVNTIFFNINERHATQSRRQG